MIRDAYYLPSGRVFLSKVDGYTIESTEMRDVTVSGKHTAVRESTDVHEIWKHLVPYSEKWLLTVSTQKGCVHNCQFCFLPGTQINTVYGTISIEDVKINDDVLGYDLFTQELCNQRVTNCHSRYHRGDIINLELNNGHFLHLTPEHPVYTQRGWVLAQDLCETDELMECN